MWAFICSKVLQVCQLTASGRGAEGARGQRGQREVGGQAGRQLVSPREEMGLPAPSEALEPSFRPLPCPPSTAPTNP